MDVDRRETDACKGENARAAKPSSSARNTTGDTPTAVLLHLVRHETKAQDAMKERGNKYFKHGNGRTSKYLGVSKKKQSGKWQVRNGKNLTFECWFEIFHVQSS